MTVLEPQKRGCAIDRLADTEFRELRMADVMAEFHDGPHATPQPSPSGPVYLGIKNLTSGGSLDLSSIRHISVEDFPRWTKRVTPQVDDLVFTYEATLHRYALIPEGFEGCLGRRLALIRPRRDRVDPKYLHLMMLGPEWRRTVEDRVISGSTVDRIPLIDFPEFPIRVPPLTMQRRIAAVLSAFDELIEINERRIELLDDLARSLYREWFVHFRFPDHEGVDFVDSELGSVPKGWKVRRLKDVAMLDKGLSYSGAHLTEIGQPMANLKCLAPSGGFRRAGTKHYSGAFKPRHAVGPDDLVVANTDLTQAGKVIGSPAIIPTRGFSGGGLISHHLFAVRPLDGPATTPFLFHLLAHDEFRAFARSRASGTTVLGLRADDALEFRFVAPPVGVRDSFNVIAATFRGQAEALRDLNEDLATTRDLLLPRLVTGRLDLLDMDLGVLTPTETE